MSHFIRGYFDGDGNISNSKDRLNSYVMSIAGNVEFNKKLSEFLLNNLNIICKIRQQNNITILKINKRCDIITMREYLYNNSTTYLKRKKDTFLNVHPISN